MVILRDIKTAFAKAAPKDVKLVVEGTYVVDYKDWNGQIQLIRAEEGPLVPEDDLVSVAELLEVFADEKFNDFAIADEDGVAFDQAASTKFRLNFKYENK